ncbi:MAG: hypothetical protein ABFD89_09095 [Bryobacteraceae bacterium]
MNGGIREYARYRGVSHTAVRKAIASQRIKLREDGTIDFERANGEWKRNTAAPPLAAIPEAKPVHARRRVQALVESEGESLSEARTRRERAEADLAELKARRAAGEVIEAEQARKTFAQIGRIYAAGREGMPKQLAPKLIGLTDLTEIEAILRSELRAADARISDEIESRHGELLQAEGAADGNGLGSL